MVMEWLGVYAIVAVTPVGKFGFAFPGCINDAILTHTRHRKHLLEILLGVRDREFCFHVCLLVLCR